METKLAIPAENTYARSIYKSTLAICGFGQTQIESIREHICAPLHQCLTEHLERLMRLHPITKLPARLALRYETASVYARLDYVLATAVKPCSVRTVLKEAAHINR